VDQAIELCGGNPLLLEQVALKHSAVQLIIR
jgi:hypothetical protein